MPSVKKDGTTDIESRVKKFCASVSAEATELLSSKSGGSPKGAGATKSAKTGSKQNPSKIEFAMVSGRSSFRTPKEQALQVAKGRSWTCWGAHMTDNARHVVMKVDGKSFSGMDGYPGHGKGLFGEKFEDFKKLWATNMASNRLRNFRGKDGWGDGDEFHLELPDSKMKRTDPAARACLDEYTRLTRTKGMKVNEKFEGNPKTAKALRPLVSKYEKAGKV